MKEFLGRDFFLENSTALSLYENFARDLPIIDYHCHLSPKDIAEDRVFDSITDAWLEGDHYKWRAMRANGVHESYITGNADPFDKFKQWAATVPYTVRNPLYHWTHLELRRYFGVEKLLNLDTSNEIYEEVNEKLTTREFSCRALLLKMNVKMVGTTDDPADDLNYHKQLQQDDFPIQVLPTFRPDKLYAIEDPVDYNSYLSKLEGITRKSIESFEDLLEATKSRIDYFDQAGCRAADHGLEQLYPNAANLKLSRDIFIKILEGKKPTPDEVKTFRMTMLIELGKMYADKGWVQQFHLGAIRNNNTRMLKQIGADSGYDSIGDFAQVSGLSYLFNELNEEDKLPKTIVYNLNPADNEAFASMVGNFNDGIVPGKMQFGSGWWYLDQKDGMEKQMNTLSNLGLLSRFVGMLTDSRSFLSFPRHEYFRRILCNLIGKDIENGELPNDIEMLGSHIQNICYYNAKSYFKLNF